MLIPLELNGRSNNEENFIASISIAYANKLLYEWRLYNCCKGSIPR